MKWYTRDDKNTNKDVLKMQKKINALRKMVEGKNITMENRICKIKGVNTTRSDRDLVLMYLDMIESGQDISQYFESEAKEILRNSGII